jgi:hypothetical protein
LLTVFFFFSIYSPLSFSLTHSSRYAKLTFAQMIIFPFRPLLIEIRLLIIFFL